jgi:hypothetical protein
MIVTQFRIVTTVASRLCGPETLWTLSYLKTHGNVRICTNLGLLGNRGLPPKEKEV